MKRLFFTIVIFTLCLKPAYSQVVNSDLDTVNANAHQEVLSQFLNIMSRHFYSYLELMQDIDHDILIEDDLL